MAEQLHRALPIYRKTALQSQAQRNQIGYENPRHTSHPCPRCGEESQTFSSPEHQHVNGWGAWMKCPHCGWNCSRDSAAAINIARLAATYFAFRKVKKEKTLRGLCVRDSGYQPAPKSE